MPSRNAKLLAVLVWAWSVLVPAATLAESAVDGYSRSVKSARSVTPLGPTLFGDSTNMMNGSTQFSVVDVSVPTNGTIPVAVGRTLSVDGQTVDQMGRATSAGLSTFGYHWDLDVPRMRIVTDARVGWSGQDPNGQTGGLMNPARCTQMGSGPSAVWGLGTFRNSAYTSEMYWSGVTITIPGAGSEQLIRFPNATSKSIAGKTYYATTKSNWLIGCEASLANGVGEGFSVTTPDGVIYLFTWLARRPTSSVVDDSCGSAPDVLPTPMGLATALTINCTKAQVVPRDEVFLYATLATDRFGNTVSYTFDPVNPEHLTQVASSDGATISLNYSGSSNVQSIVSAGRTWSYLYSNGKLQNVALPDGTSWSYSYGNNIFGVTTYNAREVWANCHIAVGTKTTAVATPGAGESNTITITHPSGAVGIFDFRKILLGTREAEPTCVMYSLGPRGGGGQNQVPMVSYPSDFQTASLYRKRISGPGLPAMEWKYTYTPSWTTPYFSETTVRDGTGAINYYKYGSATENFGQLLTEAVRNASGAELRSTSYEYMASAQGQLFSDAIGDLQAVPGGMYGASNWRLNRPQKRRSMVQQGVTFSRTVDANCGGAGIYCFDAYARPTKVTAASFFVNPASNQSRTESFQYFDSTSPWVLGQLSSTTCVSSLPISDACDGDVESLATYDSTYATPVSNFVFGKLQSTVVRDVSSTVASGQRGTLKTSADAAGNTTSYSQYRRGIPQLIELPHGAADPAYSVSAIIDDNGLVQSTTDQKGSKTCYAYDLAGRLSRITYTSESAANTCSEFWNPTIRTFQRLPTAEFGVPAGAWMDSESTGNGIRVTYRDAFWRPILVHEFDSGNVPGSESFVKLSYTARGLPEFLSDESRSSSATSGRWTSYDALDRVTAVSSDSELGLLTSTITYGSEFVSTTTNAKGVSTAVSYQVFDSPSFEAPVGLALPENAYTTIARDPFGKPKSISRSGIFQGDVVGATRYFVYDSNQRLCKTLNPESNATIVDYDVAGNVAWTATGQPYTWSAIDCDRGYVSDAAKSTYLYDALNRQIQVTTPGGTADLATEYFPDDRVKKLTTRNADGVYVISEYFHNRRGLLISETSGQPGWYVSTISYGYDANGSSASLTYPDMQVISYAPDALGRPTQIGAYATGVTYHPNGAISGFTYGNGFVHSMTRNVRGLPWSSRDQNAGGVVQAIYDTLTYDANGNVTKINDGAQAGLTTRAMTYDNLDRLLTAQSIGQWGTASFAYDPLDNLRQADVATRQYRYTYDTNNRLTAVKSPAGAPLFGLTWDSRGNLASKGADAMQFDASNRLYAFVGKEGHGYEGYRYDGLGRRVLSWNQATGNVIFHYSRDGRELFASDGRRGQNRINIYLGNTVVATRTVDWGTGTAAITYLHTDALGSPVAESSAAGVITKRISYEPYGAQWGAKNIDGIGYTGHVMDQDTGLTYMQQRYYDPAVATFLSTDPVSTSARDGSNFSRFWYANQNPMSRIDPDGRESPCSNTGSCGNPREAARAVNAIADGLDWFAINVAYPSMGIDGPIGGEVGAAAEMSAVFARSLVPAARAATALERAQQISGAMSKVTQSKVTIAVVETKEGTRVVASSEGALRSAASSALRPGEVAAKGQRGVHAEVNGVNGAKDMGLTPTSVAPSRPACTGCQQAMDAAGVRIEGPLKPAR